MILRYIADVRPHYHHGDEGGLPPEALDESWNPDDIVLRTIGVDIGSSTSHLMFATLHMRRLGQAMSSRYVVVSKEIIYESPIELTRYRADQTIDTEPIRAMLARGFMAAGLKPDQVDTGAVILTGEALRRVNSRAIADMVAMEAGKLVCASAGHHLEALLAAHGSGAVAESLRSDRKLLHIDIGGGTTKLAVIEAGRVRQTAALNVGSRLVAFDADFRLSRVDPAVGDLGFGLWVGDVLKLSQQKDLVRVLVEELIAAARGQSSAVALTPPISAENIDAVTFSGGVAEFIYGRSESSYGDLGRELASAIVDAAAAGKFAGPFDEVGGGIRATVLGASQYTVQVSGDTLMIDDEGSLPLRNVAVAHVVLSSSDITASQVQEAIEQGCSRVDLDLSQDQAALFFDWDGRPSHPNLVAIASAISKTLGGKAESTEPTVLVFSSDVGRLVGQLCHTECGFKGQLISIDSVELRELDYIDVGQMIEGRRVVPVVVKSLVFGGSDRQTAAISSAVEE